jgi:hypothetical protein
VFCGKVCKSKVVLGEDVWTEGQGGITAASRSLDYLANGRTPGKVKEFATSCLCSMHMRAPHI